MNTVSSTGQTAGSQLLARPLAEQHRLPHNEVGKRGSRSQLFIPKSNVFSVFFFFSTNDELVFCLTFWYVTLTVAFIKKKNRTTQQGSLTHGWLTLGT